LEEGSVIGTIGGGLLEAHTTEASKEVFETRLPKRLFFSLKGTDVAESGMLCGGEVEVFLEPILSASKESSALYRAVDQTLNQGDCGLVATLLDPEVWKHDILPKLYLDQDGEPHGVLPGAKRITETLTRRKNALIKSRQTVRLAMENDEGKPTEVLVEPIIAPSRLYVFGAGHVSQQIVPLAHRVGFHVTVIDDREDFAAETFFPEAKAVRCMPFEGLVPQLRVDLSTFLVIVTRGHLHDKMVLAQSLKTPAKYIGMIGSRRKRDIIYEKLLEEGFTDTDLKRVHSPVGIDIGAQTPAEIAVSIVAQLIQVRAGGLKWPADALHYLKEN
jgi:xanthine dehydrogenase accessory factor